MFFKLKGERAKEDEESTKEVNKQLERALAAMRVRERLRWEKAQRAIGYYRDKAAQPDGSSAPGPADDEMPGE